jgi:hypothetical protein
VPATLTFTGKVISSSWREVTSGIPQGSVLGPLQFIVFINDMGNDITYNISLFADDATHSHSSENLLLAQGPIQMDINKLLQWGTEWVTSYNETKTEYMIVSRRQNPSIFDIYMNNSMIRQTPTHKHIGLIFNERA